jgi:hypothetical protein
MAGRVAALKRRAAAAGVPSIYVNDNFGQWAVRFPPDGEALHGAVASELTPDFSIRRSIRCWTRSASAE